MAATSRAVVGILVGLALVSGFIGSVRGQGTLGGDGGFVLAPAPTSGGYFLHDLATKIGLVLVVSGVGVALVLTRALRLRPILLLASVGALGFWMAGFLCPVASVQNVFLKAGTAYLLLFLVPVVLALLLGRLYCGGVCPFGALQELLHVRRWAVPIPARLWRPLGALKYAVLVFLVVRVLATHTVLFRDWTPFKAFFSIGGTAGTLAVSAAFALLSVVTFRPFCRVLCPLGALLALISRASLVRVRAVGCSACGVCDPSCPVDAIRAGSVDSGSCLLCGACIRSCPGSRLSFRRGWTRESAERKDPS